MTSLLNEWRKEGERLRCRFAFKDFKAALDFVNRVGDLAEEANHHPDIHIFYNEVELELWTHTAGGVTEKDWELAASISAFFKKF
mgnify:CR=1 FL=1